MTQYYVSTTGNNANTGLTTAQAWATLTRAGSAGSILKGGDFVDVLPGNYGNQSTFKSGTSKASRITYRSSPAYAPWSAQIHGTSGLAWQNQGSFLSIEDFYVTGPACTCGIMTFEWTTGLGLGQKVNISGCKVENILTNGNCGQQAGIHTANDASSCTIANCIIGKVAPGLVGTCNTMHGIYMSGAGDIVVNCIVYNCSSCGIQQWHGSTHGTFIGNTCWGCVHGILVGQGDAGVNGGSKNNFVANNISRNNTKCGIIGVSGAGTGSNIYRNNCCFSNGSSNFSLAATDSNLGALTVDPKMKNWLADGTGDYHLSSTSACRNAGTDHGSASLGNVTFPIVDLDGNARPQGTAYDIGAYEFVEGGGDTTAPTLSSPTGGATGQTTATVGVTTNEAGGTLYVYVSVNATETAAVVVANGSSQSVTGTGAQTKNVTGLTANTTYRAHFVQDDSSLNRSTVANSAAFTTDPVADTTAPTLTSPTGASTGQTTATCTVSTNEGNGTMYCWVTTNASESANNIALNGTSQAISSTGVKTFNVTGLTANTTYFAHFVHDDAAANRSAASNSASFTTDAAPDTTAPVLSLPTGTSTGPTTATVGVTTDEGNGILYYWVTTNASETAANIVASGQQFAPTSASGKVFNITSLNPATTYFAHFVQDDAALNRSNVVHSASFTTDAAPAGGPNSPGAGGSDRRRILH